MLDQPLLTIVVVIILVFYTSQATVPIINKRGDEALSGVVRGVPVSLRTRQLMLFTHYMPLCVFLATYVLVAGIGLFGLARAAEDEIARAVGYMGAVMCFSGSVVWIGLGGAWFLHTWAELRQAKAG